MFENFGTAIVQAVGFFGVFGFFVYRLLSEKVSSKPMKVNNKNIPSKNINKISSEKKGLFGRKSNVKQKIDTEKKESKKGWFNR